MWALVTIVISFVLTGLIGNWLAQRWQQRNWLAQHTLQSAERDLDELRKIIDEILVLGDARYFRTLRVAWHLNIGDTQAFDRLRQEYDQAVVNWNDHLNSLKIRLRMYVDYRYTDVLGEVIQAGFHEVSSKVDAAIRSRGEKALRRSSLAELETTLNAISGQLFNLSRSLLDIFLKKQKEAYEGKPIFFCKSNLDLFPRWYLFKALFKPPFPMQAVSSTALNFGAPFLLGPQGAWIH